MGGIGLNAAFLKFGRDDEREADRVGAEIMAKAGYDPEDMARFFDLLAAQRKSNPGKVEQFFSSHPSPGDRAALIRQAGYQREHGRDDEIGGLTRCSASCGGCRPRPDPAGPPAEVAFSIEEQEAHGPDRTRAFLRRRRRPDGGGRPREPARCPRPHLPSKYFYDDRGSRLFEEITRTPEYYQTRTEEEILRACAYNVVARVAPQELVELGGGVRPRCASCSTR